MNCGDLQTEASQATNARRVCGEADVRRRIASLAAGQLHKHEQRREDPHETHEMIEMGRTMQICFRFLRGFYFRETSRNRNDPDAAFDFLRRGPKEIVLTIYFKANV